jgi:MFS family permease
LTTPLRLVLLVTFLASLGTGVFWHGLAFIAKQEYGFTQEKNLILYAVMGAIYTLGAFLAGGVTRRVGPWLSPRGVLVACIGGQVVACALPAIFTHEWAIWASASVVTLLAALSWPIIESFVTSGRHGPGMRKSIAAFNLVWMPATIVPMLVLGPLLEHHSTMTILGLGVALIPAIVAALRFAPRPAPHEADLADGHVSPEYPFLLRSARVLLPLSYLVSQALTPILPYLLERLHVEVHLLTPVTSTWMFLRVAVVAAMLLVPFWHGRWGALLFAGLSMAGGFAGVVLAPSLPVLIVGLAFFGMGIGIIYYAALYYVMAVGHADVDASGTHEALIGVGYLGGPLAGLAGGALGGGSRIVLVVWATIAVGSVGAVLPYFRARRAR